MRAPKATRKKPDKDYSQREAQERFERTLRAALKTPHKPQKALTKKQSPARRKP